MVVLEGERSTVTDVDSGVPQGSPGPTFVPGLYQRPPGSCQFPDPKVFAARDTQVYDHVDWVSLLGNVDGSTFFRVEHHLPVRLPLL
jgi:hypothetical protein